MSSGPLREYAAQGIHLELTVSCGLEIRRPFIEFWDSIGPTWRALDPDHNLGEPGSN
jgi:hypothetical protein